MLLKRALLVLAAAVALPYCFGPIYRFPEARPFSGQEWFNPYAQLHGTWQRANLHAHGRAWGGFTNGRQPNEEVVRRYRAMGYSVAGVSNYHHIAAFEGVDTLPLYEHGYNIVKRHQLAIGARRVEWFDLLLWQSLSHQQYVIDRVHTSADLVALTHPPTRDAYDRGSLHSLTGYELIEVANGRHASEAPWDAALSSGRTVWAIGNDDTHDLEDPQRTAVAWTMIDAPGTGQAEIISALRSGRAYAVVRKTVEGAHGDRHAMDLTLEAVAVDGNRLIVTAAGQPARVTFIGQNGGIRKVVDHTLQAEYALEADDSYIRAVIDSPRLAIFVNPVLRTAGGLPQGERASVDRLRTWLLRIGIVLAILALIVWRRRATGSAR
jgi:hypothetical protein